MHLRLMRSIAIAVCCTTFAANTAYASKLLRYPDIHEDQVVFTQGGDLWIASVGEVAPARRLTTHPGLELFAKFSPDGKWVAFTAQYDGDEQVYVVPSEGGEPKRLTYYPAGRPRPTRGGWEHQVFGWAPTGKEVLFKSSRDSWKGSRLFTVPIDGGLPQSLEPPLAGSGDFSPDGHRLFYAPLSRDFRTWKRYEGGWAQDLYIYDLKAKTVEQITSHKRTDRDPMWIKDRVAFASDRDGRLNLYSYDLATKKTVQLTHYEKVDVRWPSTDGKGKIVYELEGQLHVYDLEKGEVQALQIRVPSESISARPRLVNVEKYIESFALSPKAKRALFVARGDVFSLPIKKGVMRNLTRSSNAHDREAQWSPDGKSVSYISDAGGEEAVWLLELETGKAKQLTTGHQARLYHPRWSPDGQYIAYGDKEGCIYVISVDGGEPQLVVDEPGFPLRDWVWSPRGGFLAFTQSDVNNFRSIYIYGVRNEKVYRVTGGQFNEFSPAWSPEGELLYFIANRNFASQLGVLDGNSLGADTNVVLALALQKTSKNPFAPSDDTDDLATPESRDKDDESAEAKDIQKDISPKSVREAGYIEIDFDGIEQRVVRTPISPGHRYDRLLVTKTHIYYLELGLWTLGSTKHKLMSFDIGEEKTQTFAENVNGYAFSRDTKKVLISSKKKYELFEVAKKKSENVSIASLQTRIIPQQEWETIFDEVWRRFRDYFYVANMHGNDWEAIRTRYRSQLADVGHREELNDLMGQMIAELNVSHAYVSGGDLNLPKRAPVSLLGARFGWDTNVSRYFISKIFRGHNAEPKYRSPLTEVGSNIQVGDYVLAINGAELGAGDNPYALLTLPKGAPVELLLSRTEEGRNPRKVLIQPIDSENDLVYLEYVLQRLERVSEATAGKVGYIHIPDMGARGLSEFTKWYYSQSRKDGLIIDVRGNGGGFVSQMMIDRLTRKILGTYFSRTSTHTGTYPLVAPMGAMVTLINETSGSDGDIFPWAFRVAGLGPLIGKRTWGGVIGMTDHGPLLDGGDVYVPEFSMNDRNGAYIIEGKGVSPDIEVENNPVEVAKGKDPQLERAIKEVQKLVDQQKPIPLHPPSSPIR